jgi:2-polyprenyl-3-methyl-5-hydroxy-6-metoxy-1,4-benzoquinol methylase
MDAAALRMEMERLGPWHHDIEIAPGLSTMNNRASDDPAKQFQQHYSPETMMGPWIRNVYPDGLGGRSFLDCACNSGAHSIAAARLGAGRVFGFDAREHWVNQAKFLARALEMPDVSFGCCELKDLPGLRHEPFDVTLFSGIFYHLPDPMAGLKIAADLTRELLIVNTSVLPRRGKVLTASSESATAVLSGVDGLAWMPSGPPVVQDILAWCGFPHTRIDMYWTPGFPKGWKRLQVLAARDPALFAHYDLKKPHAKAPPTLAHRVRRRVYKALRRN